MKNPTRFQKNRVGIVTITNGPDNYGNMLQNYALQKILQSLGYKPETINNLSFKEYKRWDLYVIPKLLLNYKATMKTLNFIRFRRRFLKYSPMIVTKNNKNLKKVKKRYIKIICGSDQIWNPNFKSNQNWDVGLLSFADNDQKIAFSASFGVEHLDESLTDKFSKGLAGFQAISVREDSATQIVKYLTGGAPQRVLDPTMILEEEQWNAILKEIPSLKGRKFIMKYVLGDKNKDVESFLQDLNDDQNQRDSLIVDLSSFTEKYGSVGPAEFLWLIKKADMVLTDSFHATVFSILFHTRFMTFIRQGSNGGDMSDRFATIFGLFGIENHIYTKGMDTIEYINYHYVEQVLKEERGKAVGFLKRALED